ncbi:ABC transporter permease [Breznakiella homolactica]|uniref:FtsX-like permease family protein n=1 Tax=Breznakiella homolactica TaxID=2798577 RepID=A0A7T8BAS8_9SPIR|nr:FtsX-like permease family protein [Breznakiella homolactica]QQO09812.1 FtsX-like permease family protein [Breznakiella homolactica]
MKVLKIFQLALKYLYRYRRRYLFLAAALIFGFGIVTFITALKDGMAENVYNSAQSHYAGDIVITGDDQSSLQRAYINSAGVETILSAIEETALNPTEMVLRTHSGNKGVVFFNGEAVRLKYVIGVDWENEARFFKKLNYSFPPINDLEGDDSIILSMPVAEELGTRIGDSLILETETRTGQKNTGVFIVRAIVEDTSIFGYYKAYVSRLTLNRLLRFGDNDCSAVGLFFSDRSRVDEKKIILQNALEDKLQMGPLVSNRDELEQENNLSWSGIKYMILTIPVYLSEVSELLNAMDILTYFLYIMMLMIIFVSAMVTYRLILHERMKEVGTMRAIGFYEVDIRFLLTMETVFLGVISLAAGFILARIIIYFSGFLSFSWFPSFEIFMKEGRLSARYMPRTIFTNIIAVFCILFPAVWFPSYRASRSPLPNMLSGGMK